MTALLEARDLWAGYKGVPVVKGLDLEVGPGEIVALLGPNGAGKTTTMLTLAGELPAIRGEVWSMGERTDAPLHRRVRDGLAFVTEERSVFMRLTTRQNLGIGRGEISRALELFPELQPLMARRVGLLSGGEQQMLTLGRALASDKTRVLLADELSLGLAPLLVERLFRAVKAAADAGIGVVLVEQHVHRAIDVADRVYVLSQGRVVFQGTAEAARLGMAEIQAHYLGAGSAEPAVADETCRIATSST